MSEQAAGEFESALRAQIADTREQLAEAREAKDLETVTSLGLRLRYLLEVAADGGLDIELAEGSALGEPAAEDAGE